MQFTLQYDDIRYNATDIMSEMHSNQCYRASVALMMLIIWYNVNWLHSANFPFHEISMLDGLHQSIIDTVHTNPLKSTLSWYKMLLSASICYVLLNNKRELCLS